MRGSLKSLIAFSFLFPVLLSGCGGTETAGEPNASTNDIQAYLDANPDAVEKPEDVAADEAATFAAGEDSK